jgi:NFU1 iron-sulfur cluster scaffold homolog, mitochondrial
MDTPNILELWTESTPNPESQKFATNRHLLPNYSAEFKTKDLSTESELASTLFDIPFVQSVFISNHYVTITKKAEYEWYEITPEIKEAIRLFLAAGRSPVSAQLLSQGEYQAPAPATADSDPETKIKELLDKYVKPAVEMDGGHIAFKSFANGIVSLSMQGSCSGCPSASITLKSGIENLLKRMIPEVTEVVAAEE